MRIRFINILFGAMLCLSLLPCWSWAQGQGHAYGKHKHEDRDDDDDSRRDYDHHGRRTMINIAFSNHDRDIIHDYYYGGEGRGLPPGLAKRGGNLPPGLQKQLMRNGSLPPGLQKRCQPFPVELERRLPPLPPDYARVSIGANILIVNRKTNVIADVAFNVFK
jgi:hypothetical protein